VIQRASEIHTPDAESTIYSFISLLDFMTAQFSPPYSPPRASPMKAFYADDEFEVVELEKRHCKNEDGDASEVKTEKQEHLEPPDESAKQKMPGVTV
jgi:hypothetical protein